MAASRRHLAFHCPGAPPAFPAWSGAQDRHCERAQQGGVASAVMNWDLAVRDACAYRLSHTTGLTNFGLSPSQPECRLLPVRRCKGGQFVTHAAALPDNPYDGDMLSTVIPAIEQQIGVSLTRDTVDTMKARSFVAPAPCRYPRPRNAQRHCKPSGCPISVLHGRQITTTCRAEAGTFIGLPDCAHRFPGGTPNRVPRLQYVAPIVIRVSFYLAAMS